MPTMLRVTIVSASLALGLAAGCDGGAGAGDAAILIPDTGQVDAGPSDPIPPAPPLPPAEPAPAASPSWDCPANWRSVPQPRHDGAATCEPFPGLRPEACAPGEAHFPGEAGCVRIGAVCPEGSFAEDLPADAIYVDPSVEEAGDGSLARPFATVTQALAVAGEGATIGLAAGVHGLPVWVDVPVTLRGACAARTWIAPKDLGGQLAAVRIESDGVVIRDLTVSSADSGQGGIYVGLAGPASAELEGVVVEDGWIAIAAASHGSLRAREVLVDRPRNQGIRAERGPVELERVEVRDALNTSLTALGAPLAARAVTLRGSGRQAVHVDPGGKVSLSELSITDSFAGVIGGGDETVITLRDAVVRELTYRGVDVEQGGHLDVARLHVDRATNAAYAVLQTGSTTDGRDVWITETRADEDGVARGLVVQQGAAVLERVSLAGGDDIAAFFTGRAAVTVQDLTILDMTVGSASGHAVEAHSGAEVTLERVRVERAIQTAMLVAQTPSRLILRDATIRDIRSDRDGIGGMGIQSQRFGTAELERVLVTHARSAGISAVLGSTILGTDVTVQDTDSPANRNAAVEPQGRGLASQQGSTIDLERVRLVRNREIGAYALQPESVLILRDTEIAETRARQTHEFGRAVFCELGPRCRFERLWVHDNPEGGIVFHDSEAEIYDVDIHDIDGSAYQGRYGNGLIGQVGSRITGARVRIRRTREAGVFLIADAHADLTDLVVEDTRDRICGRDACRGASAGVGVGVYLDASATVQRFRIGRSYLVGIQMARGGTLDLSRGLVRQNPIGANPQTEGFDVSRLTRDVRYVDNGRNLDAVSLPVPEILRMAF